MLPNASTNFQLITRLLRLALRYRADSVKVLVLQTLLLALGLSGLSLIGFGIDYIRFALADPATEPTLPATFGLSIPTSWPALHGIFLIAGGVLAFALVRAFLNYNYTIAVNRLVQGKLVVDLRSEVYERLQRLSFRFFDAHTTGSIITRVTSDVQSVRMFLDQVLIQAFIMALSLVIYVAYMLSLHPGLTAACLATTPLLWIMATVFSRLIQPLYATNQTLVDRLVQRFAETVQSMQVIKAFGVEKQQQAAFEADNAAIGKQQGAIFWRVSIFSPSVGFLTRLNIAILLGYGGWLVIHGQLPLGAGLVVFAGLLEQFSAQVNQVATIVNSVQQSITGARRVFEILDAPVETKSAPDAVARPRLDGNLRFENVSFAFDGIESVLHEIDLEIPAGRCIAILGATGAGKSALMSLIPRFFDPTSGTLSIDGIDARQLRLEDIRRNIGIVFQESFLFSNTIAANIAFGHPDATEQQIEDAARIASAHEFITALPKGYDTILGESGNTLSGGQRQRLAIARAILLDPPILLLDDPTAAIDSETEKEIFTALDQATAGRTTLLVAHRLSTLRRADEILVMEQGRIVQRGTHEELIAQPGPYHRVAQLQLIDGPGLPENEGPIA
ncbi:ABC transporter ATP-binding protein [Pelagicoccus sp. SDUM812002]|uniref:ABC transporter ATP-binding protein n=1 Tax=Pelagicoccus sp. SDUM812002 TaxID=3041266 RepID=UPI0028108049|nr:ABC transporter ATP-binding protein [Pelagicoccus sp. SDUM812002]MDQ8184999.1 ABC transporter ATP-binding protein [Pelagicoccus sp. SDUM812002]